MKQKAQIESSLNDLADFLESRRVGYSTIVKQDLERLVQMDEKRQSKDFEEFIVQIGKQYFSGMGSLNDLWISERNGNRVRDEKIDNERLDSLRNNLRVSLGF